MKLRELKALTAAAEERSAQAARAVAEGADQAGLLDVAYSFVDSPLGPLLVAVTPKGIVTLSYPDHDLDRQLERLASAVSPRILESSRATDGIRRELDEYFEGRRQSFEVPVDLSLVHGFGRRVLEATARIPYGQVLSYQQVAEKAGNAKASRATGNALGANPIPIVVPCHRVVRTGGGMGGYTGGIERKVTLLRIEGVVER